MAKRRFKFSGKWLIGLLLTLSAFALGQSSRVPFISKFIFASYHNAVAAKEHLYMVGTLYRGDRGFDEIVNLIKRDLPKRNPADRVATAIITHFETGNDLLVSGVGVRKPHIRVHIENREGKSSGLLARAELEEWIDTLKESNTLLYSSILLVIGIAVQIWSQFEPPKTREVGDAGLTD